VDLEALSNFTLALEEKDKKTIYLEGHVSHLLPVDMIIVLRCSPKVLKERLEARDWSPEKVKENLEAEAMGVITQECLESDIDTYEIDVTDIKVEDILQYVQRIVRGQGAEEFGPGKIDYFQEIMEWY
jgi:adenylate kinase